MFPNMGGIMAETMLTARESTTIPLNRAYTAGSELSNIEYAMRSGSLASGGTFMKRCQEWMEISFSARKVTLTHTCTSALEAAALLSDIKPGDEVIMPSYTFASTANAFVLRGAHIRFVDVREDTLNLDERLIEEAISERTVAIVPVHYAGVSCEMDTICQIARRHDLLVIEDAAHGLGATYRGRHLGTIGHFGTYSFHEKKNVVAGEGGALVINDERFVDRAERITDSGTNRAELQRGEADQYTWVDVGSSFRPSEITAAFLYAQLEKCEDINRERREVFERYHEAFESIEMRGLARRPRCPEYCGHNGHMFYLILADNSERKDLIEHLKWQGIEAAFHFVPLHTSPMGRRMGYRYGDLPTTEEVSACLLRLPCYPHLSLTDQFRVVEAVSSFWN
jgi:dTDP-4-amino-4,6-dideoxygalactose transaminase